jgi:hypothetical protein
MTGFLNPMAHFKEGTNAFALSPEPYKALISPIFLMCSLVL